MIETDVKDYVEPQTAIALYKQFCRKEKFAMFLEIAQGKLLDFNSKLSNALHENEEFVWSMGHQLLVTTFFILIMRCTVVGIYAKIIKNRIKRGTSSMICQSSQLYQTLTKKQILEPLSDRSSSNPSGSCSDVTSASTYQSMEHVLDELEINPADEREQVLGILENEFGNMPNHSSGYFTNLNYGSLDHVRLSYSEPALRLYEDTVSVVSPQNNGEIDENDLKSLTHQEEDFVSSTPRESHEMAQRKELREVSPGKFKQFLHEKRELTEELGISVNEEGYILDDTQETDSVNSSRFGKLISLKDSLNNSFNLLF